MEKRSIALAEEEAFLWMRNTRIFAGVIKKNCDVCHMLPVRAQVRKMVVVANFDENTMSFNGDFTRYVDICRNEGDLPFELELLNYVHASSTHIGDAGAFR